MEKTWVLENAIDQEGPWLRWSQMVFDPNTSGRRTLRIYMDESTLEECMNAMKEYMDKEQKEKGRVHTQPLIMKPYYNRVRNLETGEIIPLWAIDENFK